jgi:hypothetical protein
MKSKIKKIMLSFMPLLFCFGCSTTQQMYYWGDYSDSLYHSKKEPGVESLAKHKEVLENIVEESENRNLRIPPGVCAELGYLYAANNNTKKAIELFQMEKHIYPESTILMDRLIMQTEKRASDDEISNETSMGNSIEQEKSIGEDSND